MINTLNMSLHGLIAESSETSCLKTKSRISLSSRSMILGIIAISLLIYCNAAEAKRDPFAPFAQNNNGPISTASASGKKALIAQPLMAYKLIGLVASKKGSRAILTTSGGTGTYIVASGEKLGKEGGLIQSISLEGIAVKVGDDLVELTVSNKILPTNKKGN